MLTAAKRLENVQVLKVKNIQNNLNLKTLTMSTQQKYHQARSGYPPFGWAPTMAGGHCWYQQARSASVGAAKGGSTAGAIIKQLIQQETKLSLENFYLLYKY